MRISPKQWIHHVLDWILLASYLLHMSLDKVIMKRWQTSYIKVGINCHWKHKMLFYTDTAARWSTIYNQEGKVPVRAGEALQFPKTKVTPRHSQMHQEYNVALAKQFGHCKSDCRYILGNPQLRVTHNSSNSSSYYKDSTNTSTSHHILVVSRL